MSNNIPLGMTFSAKGEKTIINALNKIESATSKVNTKTIAMGSALGSIGANAIIGATKKVFQFGKEIIQTGNEWYELREKGEETFSDVSDSALISAKYISDSFLEMKNKTIAWFLEMLPDAIFVFQTLANEAQSSAKQIGLYFQQSFDWISDKMKANKELASTLFSKETYDISFIWDKDKSFNDYLLNMDNGREPPANNEMFKDTSFAESGQKYANDFLKIEEERLKRTQEIQNKYNALTNGKIEVNPEEKKKDKDKSKRVDEPKLTSALIAGSSQAVSEIAKIRLGDAANSALSVAKQQANLLAKIAANTTPKQNATTQIREIAI